MQLSRMREVKYTQSCSFDTCKHAGGLQKGWLTKGRWRDEKVHIHVIPVNMLVVYRQDGPIEDAEG